MNFEKRKDLLGLKDMSREEIELILDTAVPMKDVIRREIKKVPALRGKGMITVFYENSTRTRTSFELAGKYLSADTSNLAVSTSSVQKGESLKDTIQTIEMMGPDILVMRHSMSGAPHYVARNTRMRVINAGDGTNEHPTQALLDMFSIRERKGTLEGLKVAIVGDILHSRVARSNIYGLSKFAFCRLLCAMFRLGIKLDLVDGEDGAVHTNFRVTCVASPQLAGTAQTCPDPAGHVGLK
jgi:aspartate carbamoyltransferase catalytic subunit